jgi:hypothetical protein
MTKADMKPQQDRRMWSGKERLAMLIVAAAAGAAVATQAVADETAVELVSRYCHDCHAGDAVEGDVDLASAGSLAAMRQSIRHWQRAAEVIADGQMPPPEAEQPTEAERAAVTAWLKNFLRAEAEAHDGDPGRVVLRRLNNAEYTYTIRELTRVDSLDPAREFPAEGGAGEGFTNTGQSLVMSPSMVVKYLDAAKDIARHLVLLPDGLRFSAGRSRRDFTDELLEEVRDFYRRSTRPLSEASAGAQTTVEQGITLDMGREGFLPLRESLDAVRDLGAAAVDAERIALIANERNLSAKYLAILARRLAMPAGSDAGSGESTGSLLLDRLCRLWHQQPIVPVERLVAEIEGWQGALWRFNKVGQIGRQFGREDGPASWMEAVSPLAARQEFRVPMPAADADGRVTLHLAATPAGEAGADDLVVFEQPRLVAAGRGDLPLVAVEDLAQVVAGWRTTLAEQTGRCLAAAGEAMTRAAATDGQRVPLNELAAAHGVDPLFLQGWLAALGIDSDAAVGLGEPIQGRAEGIEGWPFITGWTGADALSVLANSSDQEVQIPGTMRPHSVGVHPAPNRRVLVSWVSPAACTARLETSVQRAHIGCGNGVAWSVQVRRPGTRQVLAEGVADGAEAKTFAVDEPLPLQAGDAICLVIDPRDGNHSCDMTAIALTVSADAHEWDLAADVSPNILAGNPHADTAGQAGVWHFTSEPVADNSQPVIPAGSLAARWLSTGSAEERASLAEQLAAALGPEGVALPAGSPDAQLRALLVAPTGPILAGPMAAWLRERAELTRDTDIHLRAPECRTFTLPLELVAGSELVTAATVAPDAGETASVQVSVGPGPFAADVPLQPGLPVLAREGTAGWQQLELSFNAFRELFPKALCYVRIVPVDEVVTLNVLYREDDHLRRLMLSDAEAAELERLWDELVFVSGEPLKLEASLEQLTEFATQDRPDLAVPFRQMKPAVEARAQAYRDRLVACQPAQLDALVAFAERAFRRPLQLGEADDLRSLHAMLLAEGLSHQEAIEMLLARVLVSPDFLYKLEVPPVGDQAAAVSPYELATRLSYFLWSSPPDAALEAAASDGSLLEDAVLRLQTQRMLRDPRARRLATEFGTHWLHVSGFGSQAEKNEALFPAFAGLRSAMEEETVRFLTDFFQNDRSILSLLDADHTFVNAELAAHYGLSGVSGDGWQRVDGIRAAGRGGVLTLAATLATQAGASRTSPILRGNWLFETMLGEKLPKPPKDVPLLAETVPAGLTERQLIELHSENASCARCHQKIDPLGFALEEFDAVGRYRAVDAAGQPIDATTTLPDGTTIEGIEGLRTWLVSTKREVFVRQFCRKLLGYALGRAVQLSDEPLLDRMVTELAAGEFRSGRAIELIVTSPQFRQIRGREFHDAFAAE